MHSQQQSAQSREVHISHPQPEFPAVPESWIEYRMLDFGEGVSELVLHIKGKGTISARCENRLLGITKFQSDDFTSITLPIQFVSGIHTFWILLDGETIVLDFFYFNRIK